MAASADTPPDDFHRYIGVSAMLLPSDRAMFARPNPTWIPRHQELSAQGDVSESIRREVVEFIAAAGLPVTLEQPGGIGSAAGGLVAAKIPGFVKTLVGLGSALMKFRRSIQERERRSRLPVADVLMFTYSAEDLAVPLVVLLPDLVKHFRETRPAIRLELNIFGQGHNIWTAPGVPITDGAILKVLKRIEKGDRFIGIRPRSWKHLQTVKGFSAEDHEQWAEFRMPPGMKSVLPPR